MPCPFLRFRPLVPDGFLHDSAYCLNQSSITARDEGWERAKFVVASGIDVVRECLIDVPAAKRLIIEGMFHMYTRAEKGIKEGAVVGLDRRELHRCTDARIEKLHDDRVPA